MSYIYEHLYQGDELVERTLELAAEVEGRADLFFNLAMVCQHEEKRPELAMHFFYLASLEDPSDPGLRFSLEQSALELIGKMQKKTLPTTRRPDLKKQFDTDFVLMMAHLYQGSIGVAKKYADQMRNSYGEETLQIFNERSTQTLWKNWLLKSEGPVEHYLREWFLSSEVSTNLRYLPTHTKFVG